VLVPRGGLLGLVGALADRQALVAVGAALRPEDEGAAVVSRSLTAVGAPRIPPFEPTLLETVPADSIAMLATNSPGTTIPRALDIAGQPGIAIRRLQADVEKRLGVRLTKDVAPLLGSETVVSVQPGILAPIFTLVARVRSEAASRARLARLRPGAPTRRVGSINVTELELRPGLRVLFTVNRGRLIASTNLSGVLAALRPRRPITEDEGFRTVLGEPREPVTSLLFLDFSQLLGLGERSGLADNPGYTRSRADLQKIRSIGAASSTEGNLTTLELFLEIS
jgi:hypothetical protein